MDRSEHSPRRALAGGHPSGPGGLRFRPADAVPGLLRQRIHHRHRAVPLHRDPCRRGHQGPQAHRPRGPSSDTPGRPGGPPGLEQVQVFRDRDQRWFDRTKGHIRTDFADQLAGTNRPSPRRWSLIHTRVRRIIRGPGGRWNYGTIPGIERSLTKPVPGIRFCSPSPQLLSHQAGLPNYNSVENNGLEMSNA